MIMEINIAMAISFTVGMLLGGVGGEFSFLMGGGVVKIHNIHPFRVFV